MSKSLSNELKPGDRFVSRLCLCSGVSEGTGKGPKVRLTLYDGLQTRPAKMWNPLEGDLARLRDASFLRVSGPVTWEGAYAGEVTVESFEEADAPEDISAFLPPLHADSERHQARFWALAASVREPNLKPLLDVIFDKNGKRWPQFRDAVAAEKMHHAYGGGLLHHTVEVAEACVLHCLIYPQLDRNLLIAGALLHDIGKLEELEHGLLAGSYTDAGLLGGHITLGADTVNRFIRSRLKDFPEALRVAVNHMILSHHGSREFGSPVLPAFPEAEVLAHCDRMSARLFQFQAAKEAASGQSKAYLPDRTRIFTGDLGLQALLEIPEAPASPEPARTFQTASVRRAEPLPSFATVRLPVRGLAAAGTPEQSAELDEDAHTTTLTPGTADFLVRVTGDSMVDAGIDDRDLLLIKSAKTAEDGDLVLAHLGTRGEVVKRLRYEGTTGWLLSENRAQNYPPLPTNVDTIIQGRVVGTLKNQ